MFLPRETESTENTPQVLLKSHSSESLFLVILDREMFHDDARSVVEHIFVGWSSYMRTVSVTIIAGGLDLSTNTFQITPNSTYNYATILNATRIMTARRVFGHVMLLLKLLGDAKARSCTSWHVMTRVRHSSC